MPENHTIIDIIRECLKINENGVTRQEVLKYCLDNNTPFERNDEKGQLHCVSGELSKLKSWGEAQNKNGKWYIK